MRFNRSTALHLKMSIFTVEIWFTIQKTRIIWPRLGTKADKQVRVYAAECLSLTKGLAVLIINSGREGQPLHIQPMLLLSECEAVIHPEIMWPLLTNGMCMEWGVALLGFMISFPSCWLEIGTTRLWRHRWKESKALNYYVKENCLTTRALPGPLR